MKAKFWLCAAVLLMPGLAGCGGSGSSTNTSGPIFLVPRSVSSTLSNGLTATLTEDRSTVSVGGTVTYTATLTNPTTQAITYQPTLSGSNSFSVPAALVISNPSGQSVYPLEPTAQFIGVGASVTLAPGQSVSGTQTVSTTSIPGASVTQGFSAAGQYTAKAYFSVVPGTSSDVSQAVTATAGPLPVTAQ